MFWRNREDICREEEREPSRLKEKKHSKLIGYARDAELVDAVVPGVGLRLIEGDAERFVLAAAVDDDLGALSGLEVLYRGVEIGIASYDLAAVSSKSVSVCPRCLSSCSSACVSYWFTLHPRVQIATFMCACILFRAGGGKKCAPPLLFSLYIV